MSQRDHKQNGFTLVEMALVMVIVGIIIAGIIKAQELIENSQVTSTISELENITAAVKSFKDTYGNYPGDMSNAMFRIPACNGITCNNGNGDGIINVVIGAAMTTTDEASYFFGQLRAADFLTNYDGQNNPRFGNAFPSAPVGGGYMIGNTLAGAPIGFDPAEMRGGHYLLIVAQNENVGATTGILRPSQAETIDRLVDNALPESGRVIAQNTGGSCRTGGAPIQYAENQDRQSCVIAYKLPN